MPASIPSNQPFTLLSAAAVTVDTLGYINSSGKIATTAAGEDFDGVILQSTAGANEECPLDPYSSCANLTITGTCTAGDLLSTAAGGGVKKFSGIASVGTVTVANATDIWTLSAHGFTTGERVRLTNSGGALPADASATTDYYVSVIDANTFKLYTSAANAIAAGATGLLDVSGDGTGTHTIRLYGQQYVVGKAMETASTTGQKVGVAISKRVYSLP